MENVAHLYRITNTMTGEYYVGKHRGVTQETRFGQLYWGSGTRIKNQVQKYGTENFTYNILCIGETDYIFELESKVVTKELLQEDKLCLNIVTGGREPPSKKGFVFTEESLNKLKGRTPWNKGKTFSDDTKRKMSQAALGRKHSEETKEKFKNRIVWNAGKKGLQNHTEEHKQKMSEKLKGNKLNVGRKHMNDGQKNYFVTEKDILEKNLDNLVAGRLKVVV
jgi:group I intron endonuclease